MSIMNNDNGFSVQKSLVAQVKKNWFLGQNLMIFCWIGCSGQNGGLVVHVKMRIGCAGQNCENWLVRSE